MDFMGIDAGPPQTTDDDFRKMLAGYRLTTASILYHMPDHPSLLQEFLWQDLDQVPRFPVLKRFIRYWQRDLDGKLYRVRVAVADTIDPSRWRTVDEFNIHS